VSGRERQGEVYKFLYCRTSVREVEFPLPALWQQQDGGLGYSVYVAFCSARRFVAVLCVRMYCKMLAPRGMDPATHHLHLEPHDYHAPPISRTIQYKKVRDRHNIGDQEVACFIGTRR